jgi:hypothetical protein
MKSSYLPGKEKTKAQTEAWLKPIVKPIAANLINDAPKNNLCEKLSGLLARFYSEVNNHSATSITGEKPKTQQRRPK